MGNLLACLLSIKSLSNFISFKFYYCQNHCGRKWFWHILNPGAFIYSPLPRTSKYKACCSFKRKQTACCRQDHCSYRLSTSSWRQQLLRRGILLPLCQQDSSSFSGCEKTEVLWADRARCSGKWWSQDSISGLSNTRIHPLPIAAPCAWLCVWSWCGRAHAALSRT